MRIVLEQHGIDTIRDFMEMIAENAMALGHSVAWWKGFFVDMEHIPSEAQYPPPSGDLAIVWNGLAQATERYHDAWRMAGTPVIYAEAGWYPQKGNFQMDHRGVNAAASWCGNPMPFPKKTRVSVSNKGEILVILQVEGDSQLQFFSPWVDMASMLRLLGGSAPQTLVIRRHPRQDPSEELRRVINALPKWRWDDSPTLTEALKKYDLLATINSSSAIEAMSAGKVVLCFGKAVFRVQGAVVCMSGDGELTRRLLAHPESLPVYREGQQMVVSSIVAHQWNSANVRRKLHQLLESVPR
jgi:hypothetical protein